MPEPVDNGRTLSSIELPRPGGSERSELVLTVVFHPDTSRVGHSVVVPRRSKDKPWVLGRHTPAFTGSDGAASTALEDPFVSRRAIAITRAGSGVLIRRFESSSRVRVGRNELYDCMELDGEHLRVGVPLMLAHSVVLMLRFATGLAGDPQPAGSLLGSSRCMIALRRQVERAAASGLDVLLRGESGTGKELVARAIHEQSGRRAAPLVCVNMAAIPAELAAAALFGSSRGAFTGAEKSAPGYFLLAQGGTLFLDEIGDTPATVQPMLLRALQQREVQALGGAIRRVDVRVISATDAPLDASETNFKVALRHRLGACEVELPPLRDHPEDIGELLLNFIGESAIAAERRHLLLREDSEPVEVAAWASIFYRFLFYGWPGNVRELANYARQLVLASDDMLTLPAALYSKLVQDSPRLREFIEGGRPRCADIDEESFDSAMIANGYEVPLVARQLGVSRSSVYRRIESSPNYRLVGEIAAEELRRELAAAGGDCLAMAQRLRVSHRNLRHRLRKLRLA